MSRPTSTDALRVWPTDRPVRDWPLEAAVAGAAAMAVAAVAGLRLAVNAPVELPPGTDAIYGSAEGLAVAVPAAGALAIGLVADDPLDRVGLVTVGVFGGLAVLAPGARVPAAGAVVAGGALAVAGRLDTRAVRRDPRTVLIGTAVLAGAAVSLAGAMGLADGLRPAGSALALLGLAGLPLVVGASRLAWLAGGLAGAGVLVAGAGAPFVTGAVSLVVFAAVGAPFVLVALGTAGGVAGLAGAIDGGHWTAAAGAVCLLAAGVPATVPRALAAALGLALLVNGGAGRG